MSINVNTAVTGVNWEALLQQVDNLAKSSGTGEKPVLTFSATEADGTPRTVQVNIPNDLELPGTVDQPAIDSLCAKLSANPDLGVSGEQVQQLHRQLSNALKSDGVQDTLTSMQDSGSVMFDLYKLMALLVEVAQKQREAARNLRASESQIEQTSILNQAEQQRTDAKTAMIASAICCAIQVGAMGISMFKQASAYKSQLTANQSSGLNSARQNLSMLETAETTEGAEGQLESTKGAVGGDTVAAVSKSFAAEPNSALEEAQKVQAEIKQTTARQQRLLDFDKELSAEDIKNDESLKTAHEHLDAFRQAEEIQAELDNIEEGELRPADKVGALNDLHGKLDAYCAEKAATAGKAEGFDPKAASEELETLKGKDTLSSQDTKRIAELRKELYAFGRTQANAETKPARAAAAEKLDEPIEKATESYEKLRTDANAKIDAALKTYEDAFESALGARNSVDPAASKETVAQFDERLQTAENNLKFARAKAAQMRSGITTSSERQMLIEKAKIRVTETRQAMQSDLNYVKTGNTLHRLEGINGLISTVGSCVQGLIQHSTALGQAEITQESAKQKKQEAQIDDMKDLFNQAGDLVKSVLQLMAAVGNAESQSLRDAIQA